MRLEKPHITVIIPLYNKANYIQNTLQSVLNQSFQDFEIIIIDDGSTDASLEKAKAIEDKRIQIISIKNQGVSNARNLGVSKANSAFIAFFDADDLWLKNHLEQLVSLKKAHPNCGMYANAYKKMQDGKAIPTTFDSTYSGIILDYFEASYIDGIASASSVMIPKRVFDKIGAFNVNITHTEDVDLWIRIALNFPIAFNGEVTVIYQLDTIQNTSKIAMKNRKYLDLDSYFYNYKDHKSLKKYLDLNAYAIGITYKMAGDKLLAEQYFDKIDKANLNKKQLFLMQRSNKILRSLLKIKHLLFKMGIVTSSYA